MCTLNVIQGPNDKDIKKKLKHKSNQDDEYELSRFKPLLQTVLEVNRSWWVSCMNAERSYRNIPGTVLTRHSSRT